MAGRSLTGFGLVTKWLLIPAALAAIGYYVVGPRIGPSGTLKEHGPALDQSADSSTPVEDVPEFKEPETSLSSERLGSRRPRRGRSSWSSSRRTEPPARETPPSNDTPAPTQPSGTTGTSGGDGTDGGTTGSTTTGGTDGGTTGGTDGG